MIATRPLFALLALTLAGCATTSGTRPADMSEAEHREHAERQEAHAERHEGRYDPNARSVRPSSTHVGKASAMDWDDKTYNPTAPHLAHAAKFREHAEAHRAAANALASFEEAECKRFSPKTRVECPLLETVTRAEDLPGGVRVFLAEGVPAQAVADHIRCHHAFGLANKFADMPNCPSYVPQVQVNVDPDGKSVVLSGPDDSSAQEIRRRARAHVAH